MTLLKYLFFGAFIINFSYSFTQTMGEINIKDEDELPKFVVIGEILIENNKITKPWVIINEFEYKINDSLPRYEFLTLTKRSRENLINRSLFSLIDFNIVVYEEHKLRITVTVKERWNIWPAPVIQIDAPNINEFIQRKDWSRLSYGASLNWSNFFGSGHKLKFRAVFGNSNQVKVSYEIPALTKKLYLGLIPSFEYGSFRSPNYKTSNDSQVLFQDDNRAFSEMKIGIELLFKHSFFINHRLNISWESLKITDTLRSLNPTYLSLDSSKTARYYSLSYDLEFDKRDSKTYPLKGFFFKAGIDKYGLGLIKDVQTDVFYLNAEISAFIPIGGRFYWGVKAKLRTIPNNYQPYLFRNGLGYNKQDYIRGYELYSVEGYGYGFFKTNFKFEALNKVWEFKMKAKKKPKKKKKKKNGSSEIFDSREKKNYFPLAIYINAFSDGGYVKDPWRASENFLANEFLLGFGGGIDFVTVYDVVLRLEYVANKRLEHGFRIGLKAAF